MIFLQLRSWGKAIETLEIRDYSIWASIMASPYLGKPPCKDPRVTAQAQAGVA